MLGYPIDWAAFNIIEAMSCSKFFCKQIAYLAASQSFREDTSVLLLTTNLFKKDITGQSSSSLLSLAAFGGNSSSHLEAGVALGCLSNVCTKDLARDLAADVVTLLSSSKPYIRKKAILCLYHIFVRFPRALRPSFPHLKERLEEDGDRTVVGAAVNVICELAKKNPRNYLPLAPVLFKHLMDPCMENWVLIKVYYYSYYFFLLFLLLTLLLFDSFFYHSPPPPPSFSINPI